MKFEPQDRSRRSVLRFAAMIFAALVGTSRTFCATAPGVYKQSLLCDLQANLSQGEQRAVRVDGIYIVGPEGAVLTNAGCKSNYTWVEFDLLSSKNRARLRRLIDQNGHATVSFEGEIFGPPLTDPKLPDAIRKAYHPGWGHLGAFKDKLVVRFIRSAGP